MIRVLAAAVLASLVLVPLGTAASPPVKTFTDAANEQKGAPDIGKVSIYQSGDVLYIAAVVKNMPKLMSPGFVSFALNTDGNAKTGSIRGGDYLVYLDLSTGQGILERWNGKKYVAIAKKADPARTVVGKGGCGLQFNLANFGWPKTIGFALVVGKVTGSSSGLTDTAPNNGLWSYPVAPGIAGFNFDFSPGAAVAGHAFAAVMPTLTLTNQTKTAAQGVTCSAKLGGKPLAPVGGKGSCRWAIPAFSTGEQLVITPTVVYEGSKVSFAPYAFKVIQ